MTAEEFVRLQPPDKRSELVSGQLIVREPAGFRHGRIAARLAHRLSERVEANDLGVVCAAETGFVLKREPDTVRAPDVAFISRERRPDPEPVAFAELAPDLAVEVLSPDDRPGAVLSKVADWLNAGSRMVWVVDPVRRLVRVYRQDGSESVVTGTGALDGEGVVPDFSCDVHSLF
jgi:Uma2 family endonuclease